MQRTEPSAENAALLEKRYRTTAIIVAAQIVVTLILTVAAWFIVSSGDTGSGEPVTTLWVAVLFVAIGSFVIRRLFFGWERLKNAAVLGGVDGLLRTLQNNGIILGAFGEVIAVLGFVVSLMSGSSLDMFRAAAIALIVFFINFPRKKMWKTVVANLQEV